MNGYLSRQATLLVALLLSLVALIPTRPQGNAPIKRRHVAAAERLIGLSLTRAERDSLLDELHDGRSNYTALRDLSLPNSVPPSLLFNPVPLGMTFEIEQVPLVLSPVEELSVPDDLEALAYYSVAQLGELIRTRRITATQLTRMYLERLKRYGTRPFSGERRRQLGLILEGMMTQRVPLLMMNSSG